MADKIQGQITGMLTRLEVAAFTGYLDGMIDRLRKDGVEEASGEEIAGALQILRDEYVKMQALVEQLRAADGVSH